MARAYKKCIENPESIGDVFNFCTEKGITIKKLAEDIAQLTGYTKKISWGTLPSRPLDIHEFIGDNSKAKKILDWHPRYDLKEGLKQTIDYWRSKNTQ